MGRHSGEMCGPGTNSASVAGGENTLLPVKHSIALLLAQGML